MSKKPKKIHLYRGAEYTAEQLYHIACRDFGCRTSFRGFRNRLTDGKSTEVAVEQTQKPSAKKTCWYEGKEYTAEELYEISCNEFGCNITFGSFYNRLTTWSSVKQAVEQFKYKTKKRGYHKAPPAHKYKKEVNLELPPLKSQDIPVPAMQKMAVHMLRAVDTDLRYGGPRARESAISWLSDEQEVVRWAGAFPDNSSRYFKNQAHKMLDQVKAGTL